MPRRKNNPWITLVLFFAVLGMGWGAYELVVVRQVFAIQKKTFVPKDQVDEVRAVILKAYEKDRCVLDLGPLHYRGRDKVYRIEIFVSDACHEQARRLCREVADLVEEVTGREAQVFAMSEGHETITKYLP